MPAIDHRTFGVGGAAAPTSFPDSVPREWWTLSGDEAAASITSTLDALRDAQRARIDQLAIGERLYGNSIAVPGAPGLSGSALLAMKSKDRISFNVVQSAVDTITSKIGKNRPRPYFLTNGGNYRQRRKAKKLNKFGDGLLYENKAYDLGPMIFRDGAVWGDGWAHVFARCGRVVFERVLSSELAVDEIEGMYGSPRQMHRVKRVDRAVLAEAFPSKADVILRSGLDGTEATVSRAPVANLITVRESWRLPSGPDAKDGCHIITIDGHALTDPEPWPHAWFPFARFRWCPKLVGFWSQGLAEQLQPIQLEINKLLRIIQRSYHLGGSFKVLLENGSKIVTEHLNNEVGAVIRYSGTPPQYVVPPLVPPEIYGQLRELIQRAYEQAGVSQLSATSQKPAGLNSGKALREYNDIESDRFQTVGREYERFFLDLVRLGIETAKGIAKETKEEGRSGYRVKVPTKRGVFEVDWSEIDLEADAYVMQCFPVSSLPNDPAGRLQTVQEYAQAGLVSQRQARRLLNFPDLEQVETLADAAEEYLTLVLDRIVDDGRMTPPETFDDLALAREMALQYYQEGKCEGLEEERLELLRTFLSQIDDLEQKAAAAAAPPPGAAPLAPPIPPAPSDLVPNAPMAA